MYFSKLNIRACSHYAEVCLICQKSVKAKPFLVRTIFCTHQNFCKRNETSKIPSTSFGGCKNFVRRENPLFLDIHPSLGHQIYEATSREFSLSEQKSLCKSSNASIHLPISTEKGLGIMALVQMDFEPRFRRARKYPVRVKTMAIASSSQLN